MESWSCNNYKRMKKYVKEIYCMEPKGRFRNAAVSKVEYFLTIIKKLEIISEKKGLNISL